MIFTVRPQEKEKCGDQHGIIFPIPYSIANAANIIKCINHYQHYPPNYTQTYLPIATMTRHP